MPPTVSVLIANYNGGDFVRDALLSTTRQTLKDIEVLFVDDASTDGSREIAEGVARDDARVRVIALERNSGPGAARNAGLAAARGTWIAILDSDDIMHPDRLSRLIAEATDAGADICADDLLIFRDGAAPTTFLPRPESLPRWIATSEFILSNRLLSRSPSLGYLKPLISAAFLRRHAIVYDPALRIGEDYDLVVRLLLRGARYRLSGSLGYFYRKHQRSTSHRISEHELQQLLRAEDALGPTFDEAEPAVMRARRARRASIERALGYTRLVAAIKERRWMVAAGLVAGQPSVLPLLAEPVVARLQRLSPTRTERAQTSLEKRVCVISRQRLVGATAGNSSYLLSLCKALCDRGYRVTLVSPSPAMFGRWPFLRLSREMEIFEKVHIRGAWRIGRRLVLARDPRILFVAILTVAEVALMRMGLVTRSRVKPAAYAIAVPWTREDQLFVATHSPRSSSAVIADYAFVTPAIPYALNPGAPSLVVMHDLFSNRAARFQDLNVSDSVASIDEASEVALLAQADAIVAIQGDEARFVSERLPQRRVLVAPMAVETVDHPQPGDDCTVLFVGTNTAPNIAGLNWFLERVWPELRRDMPDLALLVAGSVCAKFPRVPDGVRLLGFVPDLAPLYADAGVVISPLTLGSGLKIKLIEAMGHGKAIVATGVTVEGVEAAVQSAVQVANDPAEFREAIARLLVDPGFRREQGRKALEAANRHFSSEACYAEFLDFVDEQGAVAARRVLLKAR
jgi:GT2 family glycosyltransferase/glycosyltransferase involved in cell wall biosynthesis